MIAEFQGFLLGVFLERTTPRCQALVLIQDMGALSFCVERLCGVIGTHSKETGVGFYTKLHQTSAVWGGFEGFIPNFETYPY